MIEKYEDLGIDEVKFFEDIEGPIQPRPYKELYEDYINRLEVRVRERLGICFDTLKQLLSEYTVTHAEELTHEFVNITPFADYSKMLEDNDGMAEFLKTEAHKPEHWLLKDIRPTDPKKAPKLITIAFTNKAVDEGESFNGYIYINFEGQVKHAFTQGDDN